MAAFSSASMRAHATFQVGDFLLQLFGQGAVLGLHRRADFLGGGVAALLRGLRAGDGRAAGVVERDSRSSSASAAASSGLRRSRSARNASRIVADRFDVVHRLNSSERRAIKWHADRSASAAASRPICIGLARAILLDQAHHENRPFVKKQHRNDKGAHGDQVGRRQDRRDDGDSTMA